MIYHTKDILFSLITITLHSQILDLGLLFLATHFLVHVLLGQQILGAIADQRPTPELQYDRCEDQGE